MTNQQFCYWLQGFFEISKNISLNKEKILLINGSLMKINEPLGFFTKWLSELIELFVDQDCRLPLLEYFLPDIRYRLSFIFYHVIDNSYDTSMSHVESKKIHDGIPV